MEIDLQELQRVTRSARAAIRQKQELPIEAYWQEARSRADVVLEQIPKIARAAAERGEFNTRVLMFKDYLTLHVTTLTLPALIEEIESAQLEGAIDGERSYRKQTMAVFRMIKEGCPELLKPKWELVQPHLPSNGAYDIQLAISWGN